MKTILTTFILILLTITSYCQDDCSKALEFKDIIKINRTGNTLNDVHNWFLSNSGREFSSSNGWDANIAFPVNGVPIKLGGGSNSGDYEKLADAINTGNKSVYNNNFVNFVYKEILKPEAYQAWITCITAKQKTQIELGKQNTEIELGKQKVEIAKINSEQKGLIGIITDETDESFVLKLKWVASFGVNSVKIKAPIVKGANYIQSSIDVNDQIGSEFVSIPFYKIKGSIISLTINTVGNVGSFNTTIRPKSKSFHKVFDLNGPWEKSNIEFDQYSGVIFRGDYVFEPNVLLIKNNASNKVERSTITGTLIINVRKASKYRNDALPGFDIGEHGDFNFTKEQQDFVNARLNKKFIISFKANATQAYHATDNSFEGCYYKVESCTQSIDNGVAKSIDCRNLLNFTLQYNKIDINGDELSCEINAGYKDLAGFVCKIKL